MILLTTSRQPTQRIRTLANDLVSVIPNSIRVNRGKQSLDGVAEKALELGADKVVILDRWKGDLGRIQFFQIDKSGFSQMPPTVYVRSVKLRREFGSESRKQIKSLGVLAASGEASRLEVFVSDFFGVPVFHSKEEFPQHHQAFMSFSKNVSGLLEITWRLLPAMTELGPRITCYDVVWTLEK